MKIEERTAALLKKYQISLTTAESATGGMIAATLINVPGISAFFQEGYITYSNHAKVKMIGVEQDILTRYGVVSKETAANMAASAAKTANTTAALAVTGVAGPNGGTDKCPVGTMYIGCFLNGKTVTKHCLFHGNRQEIRAAAVQYALTLLNETIKTEFAETTRQKEDL